MNPQFLWNRSSRARPRWPANLTACACLLLASCASDTKEGQEQSRSPVDSGDGDAEGDGDDSTPDPGEDDKDEPDRPPSQPDPQCEAGRYEGMFRCVISGILPWQGKMVFSLIDKSIEDAEFPVLQIVPGTKIIGTDDSLSGMFEAALEGTFDCRTGLLDGTMMGTYLYAGFMEYELHGALKGSYLADTDAGVPGFTGTLGPLTTKNFEIFGDLGPSAICTWDAVRAGDADKDAAVADPGGDAGT